MKREEFWDCMSKFASDTYFKRKTGLKYTLDFNHDFEKYVEKNYRINQFKENGDLFMTSNEKYFHLIGFIDALSWLANQGLVDMKKIKSIADGKPNYGDAGLSYDSTISKSEYINGANCVNALFLHELVGSDAWD